MDGQVDANSEGAKEWEGILVERNSIPVNEAATVLRFEPDQFDDKRSFSEELREHKNKVIWVFDYGKEVTRKTLENIQAYKQRTMENGCYSLSQASPKNGKDDFVNKPSTSSQQDVDHITPHSYKKLSDHKKSKQQEPPNGLTPSTTRKIPLPFLPWADNKEVWQNLVYKEEATLQTRNSRLFEDRSSFLPRMRAILLDWIMEVCEVYRLRRVTYYLAVDYIDRYLTVKPNIPKTQLQLVGVSCLFIAAKLEEIYPPKLTEFAYVCDGACTNEEILACEVLLLNTLGWDVNPMTPTGWLNLYMQIHYSSLYMRKQTLQDDTNRYFLFPRYSAYQFVRASYLIDLFSLDPEFLRFSYSTIAASAMYFMFGKRVAVTVSGLNWNQLKNCVEYMAVFYKAIRDAPDPKLNTIPAHEVDDRQLACFRALRACIPDLVLDEDHAIQTHSVDLDYFEKATLLRLEQMGFHVEKTYVTKKKERSKPNTPEKQGDSSHDKEEEDETTLVVFEIEKILNDAVITLNQKIQKPDSKHSDSENSVSSPHSAHSLSYFSPSLAPHEAVFFTKEPKTQLTFDEILLKLHDCTNKMYPEVNSPKTTDSCNED